MDDTLYDTVFKKAYMEILSKKESIIREALVKEGVDINEVELMKERLTKIITNYDLSEYYYLDYGFPTQVLLCSFEKAEIQMLENGAFKIIVKHK